MMNFYSRIALGLLFVFSLLFLPCQQSFAQGETTLKLLEPQSRTQQPNNFDRESGDSSGAFKDSEQQAHEALPVKARMKQFSCEEVVMACKQYERLWIDLLIFEELLDRLKEDQKGELHEALNREIRLNKQYRERLASQGNSNDKKFEKSLDQLDSELRGMEMLFSLLDSKKK